ncbi:MAG: hypothetical protein IIB23_01545, partial [Chloroflexi bacterium]|nr:hypothetical protein [Chloroflexota bacterium]
VELLPLQHRYKLDRRKQLAAPRTILLEDIEEPREPHQHIDLIYFARPVEGPSTEGLPDVDSWRWVSEDELANREELPLADGGSATVPDDVRELALAAIRAEREGIRSRIDFKP